MRAWRVIEPGYFEETQETIYTEEAIIREYWDYYLLRCVTNGTPAEYCTHEYCIEAWVTIHWATEVPYPAPEIPS